MKNLKYKVPTDRANQYSFKLFLSPDGSSYQLGQKSQDYPYLI